MRGGVLFSSNRAIGKGPPEKNLAFYIPCAAIAGKPIRDFLCSTCQIKGERKLPRMTRSRPVSTKLNEIATSCANSRGFVSAVATLSEHRGFSLLPDVELTVAYRPTMASV